MHIIIRGEGNSNIHKDLNSRTYDIKYIVINAAEYKLVKNGIKVKLTLTFSEKHK